MTSYSIALFLHIVGALLYFVALGLEQVILISLRRATLVEQTREWLGVFGWLRVLGPVSLVVILLSGFYMMATALGLTGWIIVALLAMVLIAVIGGVIGGLRMGALQKMAAQESGPISSSLSQRLNDPLLSISMQIRTAIALGIVFLMVVKPDLVGALIALAVAIIVGLVTASPALRLMFLQRSK